MLLINKLRLQNILLIISFNLLLVNIPIYVLGQEKYKVISTTKLNIRSKPSAKSTIIGTLNPQEQVDVFLIVKSWAKIMHKNRVAYISAKYIKKIDDVPKDTQFVTNTFINTDSIIKEENTDSIIKEQRQVDDYIKIDLVPFFYGGFTNFVSDKVSPKGRMGIGLDIAFQFIANRSIAFIPKNYYAELSLGYTLKGSRAYPMQYLKLYLSPFGYRYLLSDFVLWATVGPYIGGTFSQIKTDKNDFSSNLDIGILGKVGIEYKKIGIGVSYEHGFNNVCDSKLRLRNNCLFLNLSYRLLNLK